MAAVKVSQPRQLMLGGERKEHLVSDAIKIINRITEDKETDATEQTCLIAQFLSYDQLEKTCFCLDSYLLYKTFLVGYTLTNIDLSVWSYLEARRWEAFVDSNECHNLRRWYNTLLVHHQQQLSNSRGIQLPYAKCGSVCVRFAPEPSGFLHLGHTKAALLNKHFADMYRGKFILRMDDTNPDKENRLFIDNLLKDIQTLGIQYQCLTYTSSYFPQAIEMAEKLIRQGKAYVDDTPRQKMREERMLGIESKCRNQSVEENLNLWKEMIAGSERGIMCCLRGKLDMQDPNKSLRDPVYYRCNLTPHHRVGSKYKLYPTYDFACPFVDAIEGVTHALRSSEYHDRNDQYHRIQSDMGFGKVHIYEFSRLNMIYTLLSKRKLLWFVQNGKVDGWDDPRFPTVQGIVRRGLRIQALKQFILQQGPSKNLNLMEWDKLWAINKKIIDPVCPRYTAVIEDRKALLTLTNGPEAPFVRILPKHKKFEGAGEKATTYASKIWIDQLDAQSISENEEVTLKDWGNAIVKEIKKDRYGFVSQLTGVLHLQGSVKATKLKLTWLSDTSELVPLSLMDFDYLITKKKLEDDEDFVDVVNPSTQKETLAIGESNMRNLKCGDIVQLERKGYYRCDVPFTRPSKAVVLFSIPDGKPQTHPQTVAK